MLALFSSILIAVNHEIKSMIAKYGFEWRYLELPGTCFVNIITFVVLSTRFNTKVHQDTESLIRTNAQDDSFFSFDWFKQIYLAPVRSEVTSDQGSRYRIQISRIMWTVFLVCLDLIACWTHIKAYYYAVKIKLNIGVLSWFSSLKPIVSALLFYFVFGYRLKKADIVGMLLAISSVLILTLYSQVQHIRHRKFIKQDLYKFKCDYKIHKLVIDKYQLVLLHSKLSNYLSIQLWYRSEATRQLFWLYDVMLVDDLHRFLVLFEECGDNKTLYKAKFKDKHNSSSKPGKFSGFSSTYRHLYSYDE